jgi:multidrug resistance protein, MATE family
MGKALTEKNDLACFEVKAAQPGLHCFSFGCSANYPYRPPMTITAPRTEMRALTLLAWPVAISSLQWMLLNLIDTTMLGAAGMMELAAINSGRSLTWVAVMVGIGLLSGVPVFVARAVGAQTVHHCGAVWRQGMVYALVIGLLAALIISLFAEPLLRALDQPPELIAQASGYAIIIGWLLPIAFMMHVCAGFLQGISRPKVAMVISLSAVPLNALFNWVLIYGRFGWPVMGAPGAALGTLLADFISLIAMLLYLRQMQDRATYDLFGAWRGLWRQGRALRHFGYTPGLATGLELGGTSILMILAGAIGTAAGAAFAAVMALHTMALVAAIGFAIAASVRIGEASGAGLYAEIPQRGWLACFGAVAFTVACSVLYYLFPDFWLGLFNLEAAAYHTGYAMLMLLVPFLLFDSAQIVLLYALRACGDQFIASVIQIVGFFCLMGGAGYWAVKIANLGTQGVILGLIIGMAATALALAWRYWVVVRRIGRGDISAALLAS